MTNVFINDGKPIDRWHGITARRLLRRCAQASAEQAQAMSYIAGLMHAAEPITAEEFFAAETALVAVEQKLIDAYSGEVALNRHGQPAGGIHPALI